MTGYENENITLKTLYRFVEIGEKEGKVLIVAPDDTYGVDTAKKTKEGLQALYEKGLADGAAIRDFVR